MKKSLILVFAIVIISWTKCSPLPEPREPLSIHIMSFNVENMFDGTEQGSEYPKFNPKNGNWTEKDYMGKLRQISRVTMDATSDGPDIIGFQEIENKGILTELTKGYLKDSDIADSYISEEDKAAGEKVAKYLEKQQKLFTERITIMFEYQNKSTLEVLLESDSIAGFFTNMEVISIIADADAQAVDMLQTALDDAELQADIKLQHAEEMQGIADEKKRQLEELEKLIGQTESTIDDVNTSIDSWEKKEDELEAEAKKLEQKIKSLQTQYNKENAATGGGGAGSTTYNSGGTKTVGGVTWRWPTYCTSITSYYGYRIHPVYKTKKFHSGVDIGAGYGDTIMAAASGTVILVSEPVEGKNKGGTGYGNYCIIDHGNGYTTLYGHARDIYVKEGQKVSRGKAIGVVGSTGTSTGAHLHFEVRVNGSTTNPLNYLP